MLAPVDEHYHYRTIWLSDIPLAARAFERGDGMDAALAAPIYLRDKVALTVDERRLRKAQ